MKNRGRRRLVQYNNRDLYERQEEEWPVRICIEVLRNHLTLRDDLARDGWRQRDVTATAIDISHPAIQDEESARSRLTKLGLLTSNNLRIGFQACG
jgi:hypothetical protein